jgi:phytoene desaturase
MCASIFAVGSEDLPARVFLTYFTRKSAFKRFGFHPEGTIGLWRSLAAAIESHGGQVWLSTPVTRIHSDNGTVTGVEVLRDGQSVTINAPIVVSDVGPVATISLLGEDNVPADYQKRIKEGDRPTAMISVNFASQERLIDVPGMLSFAKTRRLAYIANFTDMCPEMAPPGWNLYVGTAVPNNPTGDFDEAAETEFLLQDLRDNIDDFDRRARILNIAVTRDDWPPQRAVSGFDMPHDTPFEGLWNVGDAVKEYANGGTTACAETAQLVADKILAAYKPAVAQ